VGHPDWPAAPPIPAGGIPVDGYPAPLPRKLLGGALAALPRPKSVFLGGSL